jgi:hypothetical protein
MADEDNLQRYLRQAESDWNAQRDQRDRADEDMRFISVPGAQWENFLDDAWGAGARPRFQYDRLAEAVHRFMAEWALNPAEIRFRPDDGKSSEEDAALLDGLFRRDRRRAMGDFAIYNAVRDSATCGIGGFRFVTQWADETERHKCIALEPVYCAATTVCWDSNARRMDKADAKRCTMLHEYSYDAFTAKWPEAQPVSVYQVDRRWNDFSWTTKQSVFVGERYEVEEKRVNLLTFINPQKLEEEFYFEDEISLIRADIDAMGYQLTDTRKVTRRRVFKEVFSGLEILEKRKQVDGKHIPIITTYGYWAYVDGMERYSGIVTNKKDPQRLFNMNISRMAEIAATNPRDTPIMDPTQMDDPKGLIVRQWEQSQSQPMPYLLANALRDRQGNIVQTGPIGYLKSASVDPNSATLLEITSGFLQQTTGGAPQDVLDPSASGKAINAQAKRIDMNDQPIMENIKACLRWAGEVYREMASDVYNKPRTVTTIDVSGAEKPMQLLSVKIDERTGTPRVINDVSKGRFDVVVDTGPSNASQREATFASLKDLLQAIPPDSPYFDPAMAMMIDNFDGTGIEDLRKFNRRLMLAKGLAQPRDDEEKAIVVQAQQAEQQPQQPDPTQVLMLATAQKEASAAKLNEAKAIQTMADTELKKAQTVDTIADIPLRRAEAAHRMTMANAKSMRPLLGGMAG